MTTICSELIHKNLVLSHQKSKVRKIAVFLPVAYRGGTLRGAKNVAKMLFLGSRQNEEPAEIVFSYCSGQYDASEDFSDLLEMGINIRATTWRTISKKELDAIGHFRQIPDELTSEEFLLPEDGMNNFCDCNFWFMVSDRTSPPLAPVTPYGVLIYDYIQRYIPELAIQLHETTLKSFISTARNASFVTATTPSTLNDIIQYVGIDPNKVYLSPMEYHPPTSISSEISPHDNEYFFWATNPAFHKNLERSIKALERYYHQEEGCLDAIVVGNSMHLLRDSSSSNPIPYLRALAQMIETSPVLKNRCHILGEIPDPLYYQYLAHARFLWHPALMDAGTMCAVEAAYLNVPCLSSDYPPMRFYDERYQLNLRFFDPYDISDMANNLKTMELEADERRSRLPEMIFLEQFTPTQLALQYWLQFRQHLIKAVS